MFNKRMGNSEEDNHEVTLVHITPDKFIIEAEVNVVDQDMPVFIPFIVDATSINHLTHILNQNGITYSVSPLDE